jgi:hypothetical protein
MTTEENLVSLSKSLMTIRFEMLRTLARVKALEAMAENSLPKDKRESWHALLDKQTKHILQQLLESFEKRNPGYAALLDMRDPSETEDLT